MGAFDHLIPKTQAAPANRFSHLVPSAPATPRVNLMDVINQEPTELSPESAAILARTSPATAIQAGIPLPMPAPDPEGFVANVKDFGAGVMEAFTGVGDVVRSAAADAVGLNEQLGGALNVRNILNPLRLYDLATKAARGELPGPKPEYAGNIRAMIEQPGARLPVDEFLGEVAQTNPALATVGKFAQTTAQTAPLLAIEGLPRWLQRLAALGFSAQMVSHAPELARELGTEMGKPPEERDLDKLTTLTSDAIATGLFAPLAGYGGVKDIALTKGDARRIAIRDLAKQLKQEPLLEIPFELPLRPRATPMRARPGVESMDIVQSPFEAPWVREHARTLIDRAILEAQGRAVTQPGELPALELLRRAIGPSEIVTGEPTIRVDRPGGGPAQGGRISFAGEAEARGVPSARQSALPRTVEQIQRERAQDAIIARQVQESREPQRPQAPERRLPAETERRNRTGEGGDEPPSPAAEVVPKPPPKPPASPRAAEIERISQQSPDEFLNEFRKPGGLTKAAYDFAETLTKEDLASLEAAREAAIAEQTRILKEAEGLTDRAAKLDAMQRGTGFGFKQQFFNEAAKWRRALDEAKETGAKTPEEFRAIEQKYGVGISEKTELMDAAKRLGIIPEAKPGPTGKIPKPQPGMVRLYQGSGGAEGAGTAGSFWTKDVNRARSYGPNIRYVDVPEQAFKAGQEAVAKRGQAPGSDAIIPDELARQAKEFTGEVPERVFELDAQVAEAPAATAPAPEPALPSEPPALLQARRRLEELRAEGKGNSDQAFRLRARIAKLEKEFKREQSGAPRRAFGVTGSERFRRETEAIGTDILDWIVDQGGLLSKSAAIRTMGKEWWERNKSDWDDAPTSLSAPHHNVIYGGRQRPNQVAAAAFDAGKIPDAKPGTLWQAIKDASKKRKSAIARQKREAALLQQEAQQLEAWQKETGSPQEGDILKNADDLKVGDVMEVAGERVEVTEIDPDTMAVTLEDGRKFGTQKLESGQSIWVEKFTESGGDVFAEFDKLIAEQAAERAAAERAERLRKFDEEYKALRAEQKARGDEAEAAAKGAEIVRLEDDAGSKIIVSKSTKQPGKWQATLFTREGEPWMDFTYDSMADAVRHLVLGDAPLKYGPIPFGGPEFKVVEARKTGPKVPEQPSSKPAVQGYRFSEADIRVGRPSTRRTKRANGDDIVTTVTIDAPLEATRPENWPHVNADHIRYEVEARGVFEERRAAKKSEPVWRVYNPKTREILAHSMTFNQAVKVAKRLMLVNNGFNQPPASTGGAKLAANLPPPPPGERLVTIRRPDGTEYQASFKGLYYEHPIRGRVASIARLNDRGQWSHGMLAPGEEIVGEGDLSGQRIDPAGFSAMMRGNEGATSISPATPAEDAPRATTSDESLLSPLAGRGEVYLRPEQGADRGAVADVPNLPLPEPSDQTGAEGRQRADDLSGRSSVAGRADGDAAWVSGQVQLLQRALERGGGERFVLRPVAKHLIVLGPSGRRAGGTTTAGQGAAAGASTEFSEAVSRLEATFGKRVIFVESDSHLPFNGVTLPENPDVIYVNANSSKPLHAIIGHEFIEGLAFSDPQTYRELFDALAPLIRNVGKYKAWLNQMRAAHGYAPYGDIDAMREIVADFVGDRFDSPQFWDTLANRNPSLFSRVAQAFRRFLERIRSALSPMGSNQYITDVQKAEEIVASALEKNASKVAKGQAQPGQAQLGQEPRFAITPQTTRGYRQLIEAPGVSPEGREALEKLSSVQSGDFDPDVKAMIVERVYTRPADDAERVARVLLRRTADLISTSESPLPLSSVTDPQQRQAAAIIRLDTHFLLQREQAKIDHAVAAAEAAMEKAVNDIPNVAVAELQRDFLNATAEAQIADFTRYLQNTAKLSPNQSLKTTAQMMLTAATQKAGGWVVSPGAIARAIQEIADNPEVFTGREVEPFAAGEMLYPSPSNEEILNRVRASGGLKGVNEEAALVLLGGMDGRGLNGVDPLLARIPNLAGLIDSLRRIKSDAAAVAREVKEFQQHFSKSGKAVGVGSAMKRYARTIAQRRTVDDYIRAKSKAYEKARAQLLGATEAQWLINNLLDGPRYRESVGLAARITGLQFDRTTEVKVGDKTKTTSPLGELDGKWMTNGPYPQGSGQFTDDKGNPVPHQFVMERDPNKESLDKSIKEAEALMKDIQQFLDDPNADPAQKESWRAVGDVVSGQWLHNITSPIEMDEYRDHPDLKHWTLFLNHLRTLDEVVSDLTGGRETYDIRQAMHGGDFLQRNLAALENDKELGHAKMVTLIVAGAKSHGFNIDGRAAVAEEYRSQILNPIAASQQHWGAIPLKVGSYIPGTAIRVTREDMEYLTTLHKFEQRVRHYSEDAIEWLYKVGSKIFEQFAGKTFTRKSAPTGPMMLTRYWNDEFVSWVRKHWDPAATADKLQEQIANVRRLIWEDKWAFDTFVRSYIFESNPDFTKRSRFADAYRKLTAKAVNEPVVVNNLRDIADAIEPFLGDTEMTREELEQAVKADIEAEVIRLLGGSQNETGVAAQLQTDLEQHGQNIIDRVVTSSLRTGGSFLDPRGKMLGPSSFYAIAKVAKSDIMLTPAVAVTISRVRTLGRLQELLKAYQREFDELNRKVNDIENSAGWWSRRRQRKHNIADINRRAELGELRFRYHVLHRRINQINAEINRAQNALTKFDEVFTPGVTRTLTALNKGITMQLLGSPGAIIRNVGGAIFVQDIVLSHMFRRQKNILFSPLGTGKMVFRVIGRRMIAAISKANPALAKRLQEFLPYSDEVMDWMQRQTEMLQRLQEGGQLPPFDYANRREAKKAAGFGGEVIRPTVEVPLHLQGAQWLFSTPPALFMQMMFPRYFDNFANEVIGHRAHQILLEVFSFAKQIGDVRTRNGKALDPTDRSQWIAPRELGITETQMTHLRKILETFGSLESLMFDYYNRMEAARKAGEPVYNVKIMRDDQMAAALLGFAKLGNVLTESNTLTIAKGGGWKSWIFTFANWPANFFNQVLKLVPPGFGPAGRKMLLPTALALTVAMAIFIGIEEFRRWAIQGMTGKVSSEPTLANVLHDPVSPEGVRYVLSAMSGGIPYLHLLLGQSSSADDLFDLSRSVPLLGFVRDTVGMAREAVRTGDVEKAFWDFSNRYLPLYATAINRMPGVSDYIESKNVARALRAATPRSIEFRPWSGGRVANPTPLTRHLRAAETAAFAGNIRLVRSALDEAIRYKMRTKGITKEQAAREIRQSISARHPEMRTYGRILAPTERQQILGRMTARQLRSYQAGQRAFETLKALANTGREIAAQQQRRRLRSMR